MMIHHDRLSMLSNWAAFIIFNSIHGTYDMSAENSKGSLYQKLSVHKFSDSPETKPCLQVCLNNNF